MDLNDGGLAHESKEQIAVKVILWILIIYEFICLIIKIWLKYYGSNFPKTLVLIINLHNNYPAIECSIFKDPRLGILVHK